MPLFDRQRSESQQQISTEELEGQVEEAQARLKEVDYWNSLAKNPVFGDPGEDPIADRVQARLQELAQKEIAVVLGLGKPEQEPITEEELPTVRILSGIPENEANVLRLFLNELTEHEVETLKALVRRMADDPKIVGVLLGQTLTKPPRKPRVPTPKPVPLPKKPEPATTQTKPPTKPVIAAKPILPGAKPTQPGNSTRGTVTVTPVVLPPADRSMLAPGTPDVITRNSPLVSPSSRPIVRGDQLTYLTAQISSRASEFNAKQKIQQLKQDMENDTHTREWSGVME